MPQAPPLYLDPLTPARDWLRSLNIAGLGANVYKGAPEGAAYPYATVQLISTAPTMGDVPDYDALIQVDVLGEVGSGSDDVAAIAFAVVTAAYNLVPGTQLGTSRVYANSTPSIVGPRKLGDPVIDRPRYSLDIRLSLIVRP